LAQQQTQQQIADAARAQLGSTDYAKSAPPCGQWKCSKFVGAIVKAVGIPVHQGYSSDPNLPPVAGDWANPNVTIKNWTLLPVGGTPQAGDVAAYKENYADATGHAGIVYRVNHVRLSVGDPPGKPLVWYVAAVVIREGGRPVVGDVLYLSGKNGQVESRLSNDLSSGCDGARWIGVAPPH